MPSATAGRPIPHGSPPDTRAWIQQARVRQWPVNLFVFTVPAATGAVGQISVLARTTVAFLVFCLLSSGMHLVSDALAADDGRRNRSAPRLRSAEMAIRVQELLIAAAGCLLVAIVSGALTSTQLLVISLLYTVLAFAHTTWLRELPALDVAVAGACLTLRALAGGAAAGVSGPGWLTLLIGLVALGVAARLRAAREGQIERPRRASAMRAQRSGA